MLLLCMSVVVMILLRYGYLAFLQVVENDLNSLPYIFIVATAK